MSYYSKANLKIIQKKKKNNFVSMFLQKGRNILEVGEIAPNVPLQLCH